MANYNPYSTNSYQATQMFPQPQGNVYICSIPIRTFHSFFISFLQQKQKKRKKLIKKLSLDVCGIKLTKYSNIGMMKLNERSKDIPNYKRGELF